jgi:4-amino-4-deoxy-L-arabinose transferase
MMAGFSNSKSDMIVTMDADLQSPPEEIPTPVTKVKAKSAMKRSVLGIFALFLFLYIIPLGFRPPMVPDEARYAEIPREMIASGDWIVPHLDGLRYFEKPVMGYWINALSILLFGQNAFAMRFPSALAAGLTSLLLFFMVRRSAGEDLAGTLVAFVFLTGLEVFGVGTFNVLDTLLSFFITGVMVTFFFAHIEENPGKKRGYLSLAGIFFGLAFLTKGFVGLAVPLIAIVPFMVWERRLRTLFRTCWISLLTALAVSLPWAVMIQIREPAFWHFFIWNEHIRRFMADNAQHSHSVWFFLEVLPGAALPWTFLFPAAISGLRVENGKSKLLRFAICWFVFPLLFFSVCRGKLATYILPCLPPLAILAAIGIKRYLEGGWRKAFNTGAWLCFLLSGLVAVSLLVIQIWGFHGFKPYTHPWKWLLLLAVLLISMLFTLSSIRASTLRKKILLYGAAPILFLFVAPAVLPAPILETKAPGEFLLRQAHRIQQNTILVSEDDLLRAACWFYGRSDIYLIGDAGELDYGIRHYGLKKRLLDLEKLKRLISENRGTGRVTLIANARDYSAWKPNLPAPIFEASNGNCRYIFAQF